MRGIGEMLSAPLAMPKLAAVLVNPGVAVPTKDVFAMLGLKPGRGGDAPHGRGPCRATATAWSSSSPASATISSPPRSSSSRSIARVLAALRNEPGCELARMSGSGATCFGLFSSARAAAAAARNLSAEQPRWWVKATVFG